MLQLQHGSWPPMWNTGHFRHSSVWDDPLCASLFWKLAMPLQGISFHTMCIFPTGERLRDIVSMFETCWGFPQVAGAIDGTHIHNCPSQRECFGLLQPQGLLLNTNASCCGSQRIIPGCLHWLAGEGARCLSICELIPLSKRDEWHPSH